MRQPGPHSRASTAHLVCGAQDMERVAKATGGAVQNTCSDLIAEVLGKCGNFEEVQVGAERYNFFKECPEAKTATIVLRGGAEQFIEEVSNMQPCTGEIA